MELSNIDEGALKLLTPDEVAEIDRLLRADRTLWRPVGAPQQMAYQSKATIIGYGGAAGGGADAAHSLGDALGAPHRALGAGVALGDPSRREASPLAASVTDEQRSRRRGPANWRRVTLTAAN